MRRLQVAEFALSLLAAVSLYGCAGFRQLHSEQPSAEVGVLLAADLEKSSPCRDSLYLVLNVRPVASLSDSECRYLLQKDRQCADYQRRVHPASAAGSLIGGMFVGVVLGVVLLAWGASYAFSHATW